MNENHQSLLIMLLICAIIYVYQVRFSIQSERFVSGTETLAASYDQIYPLDHPKYTSPQQKDFQIAMTEHRAFDPNMHTQLCKIGDHCFDTQEYSDLNYLYKSSPDIISSKVEHEPQPPAQTVYINHGTNKVVPSNSTSREMRADLFDDIVLPDLFFKHRRQLSPGPPRPSRGVTVPTSS